MAPSRSPHEDEERNPLERLAGSKYADAYYCYGVDVVEMSLAKYSDPALAP
jgi:hypothetical protein